MVFTTNGRIYVQWRPANELEQAFYVFTQPDSRLDAGFAQNPEWMATDGRQRARELYRERRHVHAGDARDCTRRRDGREGRRDERALRNGEGAIYRVPKPL